MTPLSAIVRRLTLVTLALLLAAAPARAAEAAAANLTSQQLAERALQGDFHAVLATLQTRADPANPTVTSLIGDLRRYEQHAADAAATRQKAYDEALAKVAEHAGADKVEDALIAAIEAHSLAADPDKLLLHETVQRMVAAGRQRAEAAEKAGDWVLALNLYRELDLLYDDHRTYRDHVHRAATHVRVLQLYAPARLEALYRAYAAQRGEDEEPLRVELEPWQDRLAKVQLPMLRQALAQAARHHVSTGGYLPLMRGAVKSLNIMLHTEALADTFPGFADAHKLTLFQDHLDRLTAQLGEPGRTLNYLDTWEVIDGVIRKNQETVNLPESVIVYELAEGATDTLDDFSAVIWPQEREQFARSTQGKFIGVGIQIRRNTRLTVVSPLPNTPAQKAGIKAGDIIATVNGVATDAWTLDRAVREITGEAGTVVTLGIQRAGRDEMLSIPIKREEIPIESILGWQRDDADQWDYWIDRQAGIGYIRLTQFIPQTAADLDAAISKLNSDPRAPLNGLILDLRFNPGGLLGSAIDVADRFINDGTIVSTVNAEGKTNDESRATRRNTYPRFPVVVLINQGSASASEIVSGALQDYRRAYIVGQRSYGKGSVQDLFPLDRGDAYLKLTTQYYKLPGGRIIHRKPEAREWGIEPDLVIDVTDRQVADALQMRQDLDIIRDRHAPPAPAPAEGDGEAPAAPVVVGDLLEKGVDLQLEAGLLLLKTQLVAGDIALARSE